MPPPASECLEIAGLRPLDQSLSAHSKTACYALPERHWGRAKRDPAPRPTLMRSSRVETRGSIAPRGWRLGSQGADNTREVRQCEPTLRPCARVCARRHRHREHDITFDQRSRMSRFSRFPPTNLLETVSNPLVSGHRCRRHRRLPLDQEPARATGASRPPGPGRRTMSPSWNGRNRARRPTASSARKFRGVAVPRGRTCCRPGRTRPAQGDRCPASPENECARPTGSRRPDGRGSSGCSSIGGSSRNRAFANWFARLLGLRSR